MLTAWWRELRLSTPTKKPISDTADVRSHISTAPACGRSARSPPIVRSTNVRMATSGEATTLYPVRQRSRSQSTPDQIIQVLPTVRRAGKPPLKSVSVDRSDGWLCNQQFGGTGKRAGVVAIETIVVGRDVTYAFVAVLDRSSYGNAIVGGLVIFDARLVSSNLVDALPQIVPIIRARDDDTDARHTIQRQGALVRPLLNFTIAQLKGPKVVSP